MAQKLHARVLEYRGHLLCESLTFNTIRDECVRPDSGAKGCVTFQTEKFLGASQEALDLMRTIPVGAEEVGNIAWFNNPGEGTAFAWLGGLCVVMDPATVEAAATFKVRDDLCVIVPNEVTAEAKNFVDQLIEVTAQKKAELEAASGTPTALWASGSDE